MEGGEKWLGRILVGKENDTLRMQFLIIMTTRRVLTTYLNPAYPVALFSHL